MIDLLIQDLTLFSGVAAGWNPGENSAIILK